MRLADIVRAVALPLLLAAPPALAHGDMVRIVLLNGTDPYQPATIARQLALQEGLNKALGRPVSFYTESLDTSRFDGAASEAAFVEFLRRKYAGFKPDLLIVSTQAAFDVAERHRKELWGDVPVVFGDMTAERFANRPIPPDFIGTTFAIDPPGTVDVALRLQPTPRRIVLISGASAYDRLWTGRMRDAIETRRGKIPLEAWEGVTLPELIERVRHLSPDDMVIFTSMTRDASGLTYVPRDVVVALAAWSSAPMYGMYSTMIGAGLAGGSVSSFEEHGRAMGTLAAKVLLGEVKANGTLLPARPAQCAVDIRALDRWHIPESRIPAECDVLFREPTLWSAYRGWVELSFAVVLLQGALITALLLQRRRRRQDEMELQAQRAALAHASRLVTMGELTASIAHEIKQPLGAILSNADAAEIYLDAPQPRLRETRDALADIRGEVLRANDVIGHVRSLLGRRELEFRPLDVNALIMEVVRLVEPEALRRRVRIDASLGNGLARVRGDRIHLQQVILNLLVNGMEALADAPAERREMRLRTRRHATRDAIEVAVVDRGSGIPVERVDSLFKAFYTTKQDGLGIGLWIARSIIEAHGGRIWAASDEHGSSFHFTLPIPKVAAAVDDIGDTAPAAQARPAT